MNNLYSHWKTDFIVQKYSKINALDKRFRSEVFFLKKIMKAGMKVLDVGCATGGLYYWLKKKYKKVNYTGLDNSKPLIKKAKEMCPDANFVLADIFKSVKEIKNKFFDLVLATGVFQHEPRYEKLFKLMKKYIRPGGYMLFDVKLFHTHPTICDINQAFGDHGDHRVYYIIFNFNDFLNFLNKQKDIDKDLEFYGYYSGVNETVRLPASVKEEVCSSHVLIRKGKRKIGEKFNLKIHLPKKFIYPYT